MLSSWRPAEIALLPWFGIAIGSGIFLIPFKSLVPLKFTVLLMTTWVSGFGIAAWRRRRRLLLLLMVMKSVFPF